MDGRLHPEPVLPTWIHRSSHRRIAANEGLQEGHCYGIFHLNVICNMYHSDFDKKQYRVQLQLLGANFDVVTADGVMNMFHLKEYFPSLREGQRLPMS